MKGKLQLTMFETTLAAEWIIFSFLEVINFSGRWGAVDFSQTDFLTLTYYSYNAAART